ncbi:enoyl-ACP reductase FabI [Lentzea sp. BCCO 10_0856]|uniref:Enoyl-[acyl-carrier-protein] reductase [NADH] n=1 Tax=Lentzea miocenica TaxID=3095431 RepID=A0ABU4TEZ9_9PSEU|nr:enoyl-ACP reductase FabI [Lentzea sp. BCCO 10_0856]MDX8036731.1 enoyl-ACP reductase FabI [Lentzea sp. BCCO 10_0856]
MLLKDKRILVTGVLTEDSIGYAVARMAQEAGAEVVLTGHGKALRLTKLTADRLPEPCDVLEMDVVERDQVDAVVADLEQRWGAVDGVVHAIGFAPATALGGGFLTAPWEDVATALQISTYSFATLGAAFGPLLAKSGSGSLVGIDFDARQVWPGYDWMGVAKAGLESCNRYLAYDLGRDGTRVNLVAAGPLHTVAARSVPGQKLLEELWGDRAPLGWDVRDAEPVGRVVCSLLSDWMPSVTGELIHVDGGAHAIATSVSGTWLNRKTENTE